MADKLPAMPFYAGDWFKDRAVAMCRLETRGAWLDLLLSMWTDDRCGRVVGTIPQLAALARCSADEMQRALADLADTKAANVTFGHEKVTVENRRMRRDYEKRTNAAKRQRKRRTGETNDGDDVDRHAKVTTPLSIAISASTKSASADSSAPPPATTEPKSVAAPLPSMLEFPTNGNAKSWHLTMPAVQTLTEAFPGVDILAECRKAKAWCDSNPTRRKTPGGMKSFLFKWMERAQNDGRRHGAGNAPPKRSGDRPVVSMADALATLEPRQ